MIFKSNHDDMAVKIFLLFTEVYSVIYQQLCSKIESERYNTDNNCGANNFTILLEIWLK